MRTIATNFHLLLFQVLLLAMTHGMPLLAADDSDRSSSVLGKIKFGTGMISFQDMSTPMLYSRYFQAQLRSDGYVPAEVMDNLYGVAATFALGVSYQLNAYTLGYRFSYSNVAAVLNQTTDVAASYSSINSDLSAAYLLHPKIKIGAGIAAKRNSFSNIADGHSLLSLSPLAELTVSVAPATTVRGYADYALFAYFGKYQRADLLGRSFDDTSIRSGGLGFEVEHLIHETAMLSVGFEQGLALISVPDIGTHTRIPLVERIPSPRILPLKMRSFSIALVRMIGN